MRIIWKIINMKLRKTSAGNTRNCARKRNDVGERNKDINDSDYQIPKKI